jgi:uncharacterized membrane protein YjjP (DUF1212 family)
VVYKWEYRWNAYKRTKKGRLKRIKILQGYGSPTYIGEDCISEEALMQELNENASDIYGPIVVIKTLEKVPI